MNKAIVMEIGERDVVVLTEGGAFLRVPKRGETRVGDEIALPRRALPRRAPLWFGTAAMAAVMLLVVLFSVLPGGLPTEAAPVAYVSIDINPSVELGIDADERVVSARGSNEDAQELLSGAELIGVPLAEAVRVVMDRAEQLVLKEREQADIVITSVVLDEREVETEQDIQAMVQAEVNRFIEERHAEQREQFRVTVWSAPKEVLEEAEASSLSPGKMTFYLKAKSSGANVTVEELQQRSIGDIAKEWEEKRLLAPDPSFTKEAVKKMLDEIIPVKAREERGNRPLEPPGQAKRGDDGEDRRKADDRDDNRDDDRDDDRDADRDDDRDDDRDEDRDEREDDDNDNENDRGEGRKNSGGGFNINVPVDVPALFNRGRVDDDESRGNRSDESDREDRDEREEREDRKEREDDEDREDREDQKNREDREDRADQRDREDRENRNDRGNRSSPEKEKRERSFSGNGFGADNDRGEDRDNRRDMKDDKE